MRYARQNVLLEHCPQDAFAYTHGTPAEPSRWQSADAGALHLQAVTVPDLPACCTEHSHSYRFIEKDATITAVVAAAEPRRQQIVANAIELAEELERTPDAAFCAELAAELRAGAQELGAANTTCARPPTHTPPTRLPRPPAPPRDRAGQCV